MSEVTQETLRKAYKPFDIVTNVNGDVGLIQEVNVNTCQTGFDSQISYAVEWLVGQATQHAWFKHSELTSHCSLLIKLAEMSCHPSGSNARMVRSLIGELK